MKNLIAFTLSLMLMLTACGSTSADTPSETMIIQARNAENELVDVEVPYDPRRIAVLDMAALDILDALGLGDRIVGSASVSIDYLKQYAPGGAIENLGTVKTADLEKVALCDPDIIFIGGRLASVFEDLRQIAPVVYLGVDYEKGIVESSRENAAVIASIFGLEEKVEELFAGFQPRVDALHNVMNGKNVLLGMYNGNALGLMDSNSQFNLITNELGAVNLGESVGAGDKASHGEEASWETVITLDPEYLFILDRNTAVGTAEEGLPNVQDAVENDLIKELDVYKHNRIVYIIGHANIWYTATGGIRALDIMLSDLENALLIV